MRIGVFVCHCGSNIGGTVDVPSVAETARAYPDVVFSSDTMYACSEPGQAAIVDAIREHALDGVVVASCTPRMHEPTFRRTVERAGLNRYMFEMANIREHVSWIGKDREANSNKAAELVRMAVEKLRLNAPLYPKSFDVTKRVLVIGGGVAGIQAALDCADGGIEVVLVERESTIGGKMAKLDKTFPTVDCSSCILGPKMVDVSQHPNIRLYAHAEVEKIGGYVGNFKVDVRRRATYVDWELCTGCGLCMEKCPSKKSPDAFNEHVGVTTSINIPFPQAIPKKAIIDPTSCRQFVKGKCGVCAKVCPTGAIRYDMEDEVVTEEVGAIIAATGYDLFDYTRYTEYGGGRYPDVITSLQYERLLSASGPTGGHVKRPSDGKEPKTVVFIQCVGSRDRSVDRPYCSGFCCMYTAKQRARPGVHDRSAGRHLSGAWGGHPARRTGGGGRRPGGAGRGGGILARGAATGRKTAHFLRQLRLLHGKPLQAASGGNQYRGGLPCRCVPGSQGHPVLGGAGQRGGGQGAGPLLARQAGKRPADLAGGRAPLRGLRQVHHHLPLRGHRMDGTARRDEGPRH